MPAQAVSQRCRVLPRRTPEIQPLDGVERDEIHHRVLAGKQPEQRLDLRLAVIDAFKQRPLILNRVSGRPRVAFPQLDQFFRVDARRLWQQPGAQGGVRRMQRERQRRLDTTLRQPLEHAPIANRREHQVIVADRAFGAEQLDRIKHVIEVVRRLAHAHEDDFLHGTTAARQHHLRDDLGTADLAQQSVAAGHAEQAPNGATDLRRNAHTVARQEHAFHRLTIGELDEQACRTVVARMLGTHARQPVQFSGQLRERRADAERQEVFRPMPPRAAVDRPRLQPGAENALLMARLGAAVAQALTKFVELVERMNVVDAHGRRMLAPPDSRRILRDIVR